MADVIKATSRVARDSGWQFVTNRLVEFLSQRGLTDLATDYLNQRAVSDEAIEVNPDFMKLDPGEPGPLPKHHVANFQTMLKAAQQGDLALMSCLDSKTNEPRSVICMVGWDAKTKEHIMTPVGHMCPEANPYEAYGPPGDTHRG